MRILSDLEYKPKIAMIFTPDDPEEEEHSIIYAKMCRRNSIQRNEAPVVPLLMFGEDCAHIDVYELIASFVGRVDVVAIYDAEHPPWDETSAMAERFAELCGVTLEHRSIHGETVE